MIAGSVMLAEGAALALFGRRYVDFMERNGLMDWGKRLIRKVNLKSPAAFAAIGAVEAVGGVILLKRAAA
jgi:hypothetical protein